MGGIRYFKPEQKILKPAEKQAHRLHPRKDSGLKPRAPNPVKADFSGSASILLVNPPTVGSYEHRPEGGDGLTAGEHKEMGYFWLARSSARGSRGAVLLERRGGGC